MIDFTTLPPGIFRVLLELWDTLRNTYFNILSLFTDVLTVHIKGDTYSLMTVLIGGGISLYLTYTIAKWVLGIIF